MRNRSISFVPLMKYAIWLIIFLQGFDAFCQPVISSFSPKSGGKFTTIAISGTNLSTVSGVSFGGVPALYFYVLSPTSITAVVDTGATGSVTLQSASGSASLAGFTFIIPPVISSFSPATGSMGTAVAIKGKNFSNASTVSFGGRAAQSFTVNSDSLISAIVGSGNSGYVSVGTPGGYSSVSGFTHLGPAFTSYSPTRGPAGTAVLLKGIHFSAVTGVTFEGQAAASFTILSDTVIRVVTAAGSYGVIMMTAPSGSASLPGFNLPTVAGISPRSGSYNSTDTIKGRNFTGATSVLFEDVAAPSYNILSDSVIVARVGLGGTGTVKVYNSYGTGSSSGYFTFTQLAPALYSFSPTAGSTGTVVTIKGNHLAGSTVSFGNTNASVNTVLSDSTLTATVADGATGIVTVRNQAGQASSTDSFSYTGPSILSFAPVSGNPGDTILISGTNLTNVTGVAFGNTPAKSFSPVSPAQLKAVVGNGSTGYVTVTNSLGTASRYGFSMKPRIDSFSPDTAGINTTVLIRGRFLTGVYIVGFGGINSPGVTVISDSLVSAIVPASAYSGNISVTNFAGTASLAGFTFVKVPEIYSFSPQSGGVDTVITIKGYHLSLVTSVAIGGTEAVSFVVVDDYTIKAKVGQGSSGSVVVTSAGGVASFAGFFYFNKPVITSFTPDKGGPMDIISIRGTNLYGDAVTGFGSPLGYTKVKFGGIDCTEFFQKSDTLIRIYLTANASGKLYLETPGGKDSMVGFTYQPVPAILSFSPVSAAAGDPVTILGKNFSPSPQNNIVYFGGTRAVVTASSVTSLQVIVPAGATFEPVSVTVDSRTGYSKKPYPVTYPGSDNFSVLSYSTKIDMPLRYKPETVLADINGDGKLDMVVNDRSNSVINIYINNSTPGIILFEPAIAVPVGTNQTLFAAKDIDGDGKLDILFTDETPGISSYLRILKNTGTISTTSFTLIKQSGVLNALTWLNFCDFNADGRPDLIFPSSYGTWFGYQYIHSSLNQALPGSGLLNFRAEQNITVANNVQDQTHQGSTPSTAIADFDSDGNPDVLVGIEGTGFSPTAYYFTILRNGNLHPGTPYNQFKKINVSFPNLRTAYPLPGDLNLDSLPDIICDTVAFINSGNFTFTRQTNACIDCHFIDDMDGDGKPDLGKLSADSFDIVRNKSENGIVTLLPKTSFYAGSHPSNYQIGDLDGDGKPEIIVTSYTDSAIHFLRNKGGDNILVCPGGSTTLTANLTGSTYQWQLNKGNGFVNISDDITYAGSHSKVLQLHSMADSANGNQYRCLVDTKYSYAFSLKVANTWTGTMSNAWENVANWSCNQVPSPASNVIINSGSPVINSNVSIRSLSILPTATLTVNTGYTLNITH